MKTRAVLLLAAIVAANPAVAAAASFDRKAWREDYSTLKRELERVVFASGVGGESASGVDLPSLDRRTRLALDAARTDADAAAALVGFVAAFHDGHFAPTFTPEPGDTGAEPPPRAADNDASTAVLQPDIRQRRASHSRCRSNRCTDSAWSRTALRAHSAVARSSWASVALASCAFRDSGPPISGAVPRKVAGARRDGHSVAESAGRAPRGVSY